MWTKDEKTYWSNVCIAASQITFGVAWIPIFTSIDFSQAAVIVSNLLASAFLWYLGWRLVRKKV